MNTGIRGIQDSGKTALMVGYIDMLLDIGRKRANGYRPDDVYVNFMLNINGVHCLNNEAMFEFIKKMVHEGLVHKIVGITEADRVFPARFWNDRRQSDALVGLWQDVKLFNQIFWDAHIGTSVDVMLRETSQIRLLPKFNRARDVIEYYIINGLFKRVFYKEFHNVSRDIFPKYDRWEVIR